ncbi:MAG: hypothetical protein ACF8PN_09250 [Phycisphaerales bacterium]
MRLPLDDWQFWVVTLVGLFAAWIVVRPFLPSRKKAKGGACGGCASGAAATAKPKRVNLTVGGKSS